MALIVTPGQLHRRSDFYMQLRALITAGLPMIQALENLRGTSRMDRRPLGQAIQALTAGSTLAEAFAAAPKWLPDFDLKLIEAGEQSGRLESVFETLGNHYKQRAQLASQMISDIMYPVFILHLAVLVFPASALTALVRDANAGSFLQQKLSVLFPIYLIVAVSIYATQGTHARAWRNLMERVLNFVPLLGSGRKHLALARFSSALEALLSAGVPVIPAWSMAADASHSPAIHRGVQRMLPRVQAGETPAEAIRLLAVFPDMFKSLYSSGELSGQIDATLVRLRNYHQEQGTQKIQNFGQWTPRLLFLIIAIAIGFQIIAFYTSYFSGAFQGL